jgi:hypothetical protein
MSTPKFPHIRIKLTGDDGNAFGIMARVARVMKEAGVDEEDIKAYRDACKSGDYNHLLRVTMETVDVR